MKQKFFVVMFSAILLLAPNFVLAKAVNPNSDEDVAELKADAESGDRGAQYELSMVYTFKQDSANALKWLTMSAENGFGKAQYTLGNLFYNGTSAVEKDYEKAIKWLEASKGTVYRGSRVDELIASAKQKLKERQTASDTKKIAAEEAKKKAASEAKRKAKEAKARVETAVAASIKTSKVIVSVSSPSVSAVPSAPAKPETSSFLEKILNIIKRIIAFISGIFH